MNQDITMIDNNSKSIDIDTLKDDSIDIEMTDWLEEWDEILNALVTDVKNEDLTSEELEEIADLMSENNAPLSASEIIQKIDEKLHSEGTSRTSKNPINIWFKNNIQHINKIVSEDSSATITYRFTFEQGTIETTREHRYEEEFINKIVKMADERPTQPSFPPSSPYNDGEWTEFIVGYINKHAHTTHSSGTRTNAIKNICQGIRQTYNDFNLGIENGATYYDSESEQIYIPHRYIDSKAEETGTTPEAIQSELTAQGIDYTITNKQTQENAELIIILPVEFIESHKTRDIQYITKEDIENGDSPALKRITENLQG